MHSRIRIANGSLWSLDVHARLTDEVCGVAKRSDDFYVVYPASLDDDEDDMERRANGDGFNVFLYS